MKNKEWIVVVLILAIVLVSFIYQEKKEEIEKTRKHYSNIDKNFYIQNDKLFVLGKDGNEIQVPGDYSEMDATDYDFENHESNTEFGNLYFFYELDGKIYLVISDTAGFRDWKTIYLNNKEIGVPEKSKIKYIRINGNIGFIFYIAPDGVGKILKTSDKCESWNEVDTDFELNDECELKFLNQFGMAVDGFLIVPSKDGEKCELYVVDPFNEPTFSKVDELENDGKILDYFYMPTYYDNNAMNFLVNVGENKDDADIKRYVSTNIGISINWGKYWIQEEQFLAMKKQQEENRDEGIAEFNKSAESLQKDTFLTDFSNYKTNSNEIKISKEQAKTIAEIGFTESASRIAGEGVKDTASENIELKEVCANNYFTRKYTETDKVYTNIKCKAYVVTKENEMGNGVSIYVDANTGLIIGGEAFGD